MGIGRPAVRSLLKATAMRNQAKKRTGEPIVDAIDITQDMLSQLKDGLLSREPAWELEKLARNAAIAVTTIETILTSERALAAVSASQAK